ncbi:hypothetical protein [Agromyces seonyuensis]|uniref:RelA/SpoT domain-containing protein n=1 Tax=Agromyces seonyuensis TaxID=2662446 RepID=A0A6I4P2A0_9MICO|nr:hypothetical protein [Agromyces seonyuensis]
MDDRGDQAYLDAELERYERELPRYERLQAQLVEEFTDRLHEAGFKYFHVSGRVKARDSFEAKLRRQPDRPVLDVLGIRVIANFEGDLARMEQVVREALVVDDDSWVDKSDLLAPDAFGYRSVQFVGRIPGEIADADADGDDWRVEVQLRTALSDTWSELEHDFRYKSPRQLPREVDRLFALSAALLEQADTNLDQIRERVEDFGRPSPASDGAAEKGYIGRFIQYDGDSRFLDQLITSALDVPFGTVTGSGRELRSVVRAAGWMQYDELEDGFAGYSELGRRLAITCSSASHGILLTDVEPGRPARSFRGIGVYWTALAAALIGGADLSESRVPAGRLAEFRVVASYLFGHPDRSALDARYRYRTLAAPVGSTEDAAFQPISMD